MDNVVELISRAIVPYVHTHNGLVKYLIKDSEISYMTNLKEL